MKKKWRKKIMYREYADYEDTTSNNIEVDEYKRTCIMCEFDDGEFSHTVEKVDGRSINVCTRLGG
jgi:hypothetical protein